MAKGENPAQRSKRYANELKEGKNSFTGEELTASQAGFRMGVLNERKWGAGIHKYNQSNVAKPADKTRKSRNKNNK